MGRNNIKFYYDKFLKPEYDFHGIKLIPDLYGIDESDYRIIWDIYNPNDISYSVEALKTLPTDLWDDFSKIIGNNPNREFLYVTMFEEGDNEYYLNRKDKNILTSRLKKINEFDFRGHLFKIESTSYHISFYHDELSIELDITFLQGWNKSNGQEYPKSKFSDVISEIFLDDDFVTDYEYTLFHPISSYFWNMPTFMDTTYMYINNSITPFYSDGKRIRLK